MKKKIKAKVTAKAKPATKAASKAAKPMAKPDAKPVAVEKPKLAAVAPEPVVDPRQCAVSAVVKAACEAFAGDNTVYSVMGGIYEMDRVVGDKLKAAVLALEGT